MMCTQQRARVNKSDTVTHYYYVLYVHYTIYYNTIYSVNILHLRLQFSSQVRRELRQSDGVEIIILNNYRGVLVPE